MSRSNRQSNSIREKAEISEKMELEAPEFTNLCVCFKIGGYKGNYMLSVLSLLSYGMFPCCKYILQLILK
jgi:hypothetical protein